MNGITTHQLIRWSKVLMVLFAGLFGAMVVLGNISDYATNFEFVRHTLLMDSLSSGSSLAWRALEPTWAHHGVYVLIICLQATFTALCLLGAWHLKRDVASSSQCFNHAKRYAIAGLMVGVFLWYLCFQVIAGEWFAMWQSEEWNALDTSDRFMNYILAALIFVSLRAHD